MGYRRRIIPAYAGSTASSVCAFLAFVGSSPHTRGAHPAASHHALEERIIPAYAGSTYLPQGGKLTLSDHPRIRGEHWGHGGPGRGPRGSSPHTRGAHHHEKGEEVNGRIIPAYAGSTVCDATRELSIADHPRIRGEHPRQGADAVAGVGSSPHTRGAPARRHALAGPRRIIPAYAGSTFRRAMKPSQAADHPRIRGEHRILPPDQTLPGGSSPHTRGAPPSVKLYISLSLDHPRIRGEH